MLMCTCIFMRMRAQETVLQRGEEIFLFPRWGLLASYSCSYTCTFFEPCCLPQGVGLSVQRPGAPLSVLRGIAPDNTSIGIGNWGIDVHQVQRVAVRDARDGYWRTVDEGDLEVHAGQFEIPYGSVVPRKAEVQNLIVPVCIAASQ